MSESIFTNLVPLPVDVAGILREIDFFKTEEVSRALGFCLGGVTNQSWAIQMGIHRFVVRLPRKGTPKALNREAEKHNTLAMSELGLNLPTLFMAPASGIKVSPWIDGAPLKPEDLHDQHVLGQVCDLLHRVHSSGIEFKSSFRPCWLLEDLQSAGENLPAEALQWKSVFEQCRNAFLEGEMTNLPTHGDVYRGNLFRTKDRVYLIDWEHSGANDPIYDLADFTIQADFSDAESLQFLELHAAYTQRSISRVRFWYARQLSRLVWGLWALARSAQNAGDPAHLAAGRSKLQLARESLARGTNW